MARTRSRLASAGVVFVDVDTVVLAALNDKVSFPIALHEPIAAAVAAGDAAAARAAVYRHHEAMLAHLAAARPPC